MIKVELELSDIDYGSMIEQLLPVITEKLRQSNNPVAMLLSNGMPASMAKMILKKLPPAKRISWPPILSTPIRISWSSF